MDTQRGSRNGHGRTGLPGLSLRPKVSIAVSDTLKLESPGPSEAFSDFGRCVCGVRLYRKHRIASSLLRLINLALNTSMRSSVRTRGKPVTGSMNICCITCGSVLEVDLSVYGPTTGVPASMSIALNMRSRMTPYTSLGDGVEANDGQTEMQDLTNPDDGP